LEIRKIPLTAFLTLFLSFFLQGLIDTTTLIFSKWKYTTWINLLHFWLTLLTSYYLFFYLLKTGLHKLKVPSSKHLVLLLVATQLLVSMWIIITDILFYFWYYEVKTLRETTFYEYDIPLIIAILTISSIFSYQQYRTKLTFQNQNSQAVPQVEELHIEAFAGNAIHLLAPSTIGVFYLSEGIVWIQLLDGQKFRSNHSLSKLQEQLSAHDFFRLNRQVIVARKAIKGFDKLSYQKLKLILIDSISFDANLVVSKYNAPAFKKWLTNSI